MNELEPKKVKDTNRWYLVTPRFRGLYFDIITMFILIGQILRRLNRDILNLRKPIPKKWTPSDPEDELFNVYSLSKLDFTSLITFFSILFEKVSRLLRNITRGDRPSSISFSDWRNSIKKDKYLVPHDLKKLITNTNWYDDFDTLRNRYTIHWGYSIGGIVRKNTSIYIQLLSHYEGDKEILYDVNDIRILCNDIYDFFIELNQFLCDNFDFFPINITKSN